MKNLTRRQVLIATCASGVLIGLCERANADVPVVDLSALVRWAESIKNEVESYALQTKQYIGEQLSFTKQLQQYAVQLQQYENQIQLYMNFYHNPSLGSAGGILGRVGLGSALPVNPSAVLGLVNGFQYGGGGMARINGLTSQLGGMVSSSWATSHVYTPTDASWTSEQLVARANGIAGAQGAGQAAYGDLASHSDALPALRDTLLNSTDSKSVADASAQVQTEIAYNTNEAAKLQAIQATYAAQRDSLVQRDNEKLDQDIEAFVASSPVQP